jgi:endonuclease-8
MPEGDTLYRTAETLRRWLGGREITGARTRVAGFPALRLVGQRVEAIEARGKHLLFRLDSGQTLHTHLRMSGSWHVYPAGQHWRRPESQARLVVEAGDRVAVCFNAPTVELLQPKAEGAHPSLGRLGPDILAADLDQAEVRRRARTRPPDMPLGELLLDQQVVAGIGNIWRCEALFVEHRNPWTERQKLTDEELDELITTAAKLMRASVTALPGTIAHAVYRRAGRPCRRCGSLIESKRLGDNARTAYFCPSCQPA